MKQNIYNAKLHNAELNNAKLNKQIFYLSDDTNNIVPDENEALYWLTYEDGKLISNYKVGEEEITQPVEDELTSEQKAILNKISQNNGNFTFDGKVIKEAKVSEETNNILVQKDDGLFVEGDDYTSFEVCVHNTNYTIKTIIAETVLAEASSFKEYVSLYSVDNNLKFSVNIPACTQHRFILRSRFLPNNSDVVIDWGDDTVTVINEKEPTQIVDAWNDNIDLSDTEKINFRQINKGNYEYLMNHKYETDGIYTVKIYGKKYFALNSWKNYNYNLMCSVFNENLKIASHLSNFSSFCKGTNHLLFVNVANSNFNLQATNVSNMFSECKSLIKAIGFNEYNNQRIHCVQGMFNTCVALNYTDFKIPHYISDGSLDFVFSRCRTLNVNISNLIPLYIYSDNNIISINKMFNECNKLLHDENIGDFLWNNKLISWINILNTFAPQTDSNSGNIIDSLIREYVPESWGGTASNNIIKRKSEINKLLFRIPAIQNTQEIYHLKVQFSTTGDFENIETIDTINDYSKFKIFDGTGTLKQFPIDENENNEIISVGITSVYSDEQIQLDISSINEEYKYFRFQWSNDYGDSYGRYGYGNTQALQSIFDITSVETNVINSNKQILFTHQDSDFVSWNVDGTVATFTHNMNCIPITTIYDDNLEQVLYGIKIIDGNSFSIDFKESLQIQITKPWRIIINYGVNFNIQ